MNKKVSAFIVAIGMAAAPISAKQHKVSEGEASESFQKRQNSTCKRLHRQRAEKELIKEIDKEIEEALNTEVFNEQKDTDSLTKKVIENVQPAEVILKDEMPLSGIDISEEFEKLFEESSDG